MICGSACPAALEKTRSVNTRRGIRRRERGTVIFLFLKNVFWDVLERRSRFFPQLDDIEDALPAAGAGLLFLPAYSPDLNPIEHAWSKVKARLRALKPRTGPDLLDALVDAFATITPHDLQGWFRHCGYKVALT